MTLVTVTARPDRNSARMGNQLVSSPELARRGRGPVSGGRGPVPPVPGDGAEGWPAPEGRPRRRRGLEKLATEGTADDTTEGLRERLVLLTEAFGEVKGEGRRQVTYQSLQTS
jgi:hypothetical protein